MTTISGRILCKMRELRDVGNRSVRPAIIIKCKIHNIIRVNNANDERGRQSEYDFCDTRVHGGGIYYYCVFTFFYRLATMCGSRDRRG
jgi:hypothetical protein